MPAVLATIFAFMAGIAVGAFVLDRFIRRSARAGFWLVALELTIGLWAMGTTFVLPRVNEFALHAIGLAPVPTKHWTIAFIVPALVLLPATAAMGATLPAMEKFLSVMAPKDSSIGSIYGANTLGAVAGTLLTPFVLMPALGFSKSCWALAAANLMIAAGTFALARSFSHSPQRREESLRNAPLSSERLAFTLFATGLLGIGYETTGVRVRS
jgi:spermidine synthase